MNKSEWGFIILMIVVFGSLIVQCARPTPDYVKRVYYDCRLAEISPDIPPKIKEECRKLYPKKDVK